MTRPPSVRTACTVPKSRNMRQSAATWFQPASATSASAAGSSATLSSGPITHAGSESAIASAIGGRLAEARHVARDPVGRPIDHPGKRNARIAEQACGLGGVDEPSIRRLGADENRCLPQALSQRLGQPAYAYRFGAADVERRRRHGAMIERPQRHGVGVALPDYV